MKAAMGPAPSTVSSSRETTVGSAVPQRESAAAYSRPVQCLSYQQSKERVGFQQRTHLGEGARGRIHSAPERGQGEERAFEGEVNERIERLLCRRKVCGHTWWLSAAPAEKKRRRFLRGTYEPDEGGAVLPWRVFGEECPCRGRRDERNARDASEGVRGSRGENGWCLRRFEHRCKSMITRKQRLVGVQLEVERGNVTMIQFAATQGRALTGQLPRPPPPPLLTRLHDAR
jgi:hypothetical protein